nr:MAG: hypothetical protein DIU55_03465 [Bacillota bacterium]
MDHDGPAGAGPGGGRRLTEQELYFISRALDGELLALQKNGHYAAEMTDENARRLMREHADIHHRRIRLLLALLDAPGDINTHAKLLLQTGEGVEARADD